MNPFSKLGSLTKSISTVVALLLASLACNLVAQNACAPAPAGLVSWWQAESNALDSISGNNGQLQTGASYAPGKVGTAFSFDGLNSKVDLGDPASLAFTNSFSIEGWIWVNSAPTVSQGHGQILYRGDPRYCLDPYFLSVEVNGNLKFHIEDAQDTVPCGVDLQAGPLPLHQWKHVAAVFDGGSATMQVYVDGVISAQTNTAVRPFAALINGGTAIGNLSVGQNGQSFNGLIDELSIYDRPLSGSEIAAIFAAGSAGKCNQPSCVKVAQGLVSLWRGEGTGYDSAGTNAANLVGAVGFTNGEVGQAFELNGNGSALRVPASKSLDVGIGPGLTIESWINPKDATLQQDIAEWNDGQGFIGTHFTLSVPYLGGGSGSIWANLVDNLGNAHQISSTSNLVLSGVYQHIGLTYNKTNGSTTLYLNGTVVAQTNLGSFSPYTKSDFYVGWRPSGTYAGLFYGGSIDELSLYNRDLSASEIAAIYNAGSSGKCALAPQITSQPASQVVSAGTSVTFGVQATGDLPLSYQWQLNGSNMAGATASTLVLTNVQVANEGFYSAIVSNIAGTIVSSNASLALGFSCAPPPSGLVSWWKGDGNAADSVGLNQGTPKNGVSFVPGEVNQAFQFDGTNQYVEIPDSPSLDPTNSLCIETWVYVSGYPNTDLATIITKFNPSIGQLNQYQLETHYANGRLNFRPLLLLSSGYALVDGATTIQFNTWYHVAMTYDGASLKLYVNGALDGSVSASGFIAPTSEPLRIGGPSSGPWWFKGRVDEVSFYNRVLSASEVFGIYQAGSAGKCFSSEPPVIVVQPTNQTSMVGANVNFNVVAVGTGPLSYQWSFNGTPISGATNDLLTLSSVTPSSAGSYSVVVTNVVGAITSSPAILTLNPGPSLIQVASSSVANDGTVSVPFILIANGNESAVSFTLDFDPTVLTNAGLVLGSGAAGASLQVNASQASAGRVGVAIALAAGQTFSAATQQLAVATFSSPVITSATSTSVGFGNSPVTNLVVDVSGKPLAVTFVAGTVLLPLSQLEGDVYPRPNGDQALTVSDWVLIGRYVAGLDSPTNSLEFQKADCAPRDTLGDGRLTVSDWVQAGRYAAGLDPLTRAGGPTSPVPNVMVATEGSPVARRTESNARQVRVSAPVLAQGQSGTVEVELEAQGNENALAFSLSFNPAQLVFVGAAAGTAANEAVLNVNANQAAQGRIGCVLALAANQSFAAGSKQVVNLTFRPSVSAGGTAAISFGDQPVVREVSDPNASTLAADYINGAVVVTSRPSLSINTSAKNISLSWPATASGFVLQESSDANLGAASWTTVTATPAVMNSQSVVSVPPGASKKFYRLYHP